MQVFANQVTINVVIYVSNQMTVLRQGIILIHLTVGICFKLKEQVAIEVATSIIKYIYRLS